MTTRKRGGLMLTMLAGAQFAMAAGTKVTVCMQTGSFFIPTEQRAKFEAARIFAKIGVELRWVGVAACPDEAIRVQVNREPVPGVAPGALACAYPFNRDSHLLILFSNRIDAVLNGRGTGAGAILGHILAHEIGHILSGTDSHAPAGLMRDHWTTLDFGAMLSSRLEFSPLHSELIRNNLKAHHLN